jgi:hypothetical protein
MVKGFDMIELRLIQVMIRPEENDLINKAIEAYGGRYICKSQIKDLKGEFTYQPYHIFYNETPHPRGSNYYAIGYNKDKLVITNGISIESMAIDGFVEDGVFYYSAYRHDCVTIGNMMIDGGRDYSRMAGDLSKFYTMTVYNGECKFAKMY